MKITRLGFYTIMRPYTRLWNEATQSAHPEIMEVFERYLDRSILDGLLEAGHKFNKDDFYYITGPIPDDGQTVEVDRTQLEIFAATLGIMAEALHTHNISARGFESMMMAAIEGSEIPLTVIHLARQLHYAFQELNKIGIIVKTPTGFASPSLKEPNRYLPGS